MKVRVLIVAAVVSTMAPAAAVAQVSFQGGVGTNLNGGGNSQSVAAGFWAGGRVGFLVGAERIHLPTDVDIEDPHRNGSATRGGTTRFISGEARWLPLTADRMSPYVLAGAGWGTSRPNVNDTFPDPVTNKAIVWFGGGGIQAPVMDHLSVFADVRFMIHIERDSPYLFLPVRGGLVWRW